MVLANRSESYGLIKVRTTNFICGLGEFFLFHFFFPVHGQTKVMHNAFLLFWKCFESSLDVLLVKVKTSLVIYLFIFPLRFLFLLSFPGAGFIHSCIAPTAATLPHHLTNAALGLFETNQLLHALDIFCDPL